VIPGAGSDFVLHQFADGLKHVVLLELREGEEIERETVGVYDEAIYGAIEARLLAKNHFADLLARLKRE